MDRVDDVAASHRRRGWFAHDEIILTAGGSAIFDLVAARLTPDLGRPVRGVLRSGCYLTHDHQRYTRYLCCVVRTPEPEGNPEARAGGAGPRAEPARAGPGAADGGKRDVAYDLDLPLPSGAERGQGGAPSAAPTRWRIDAPQRPARLPALRPAPPAGRIRRPGALGISHPCTTFDKWRWLPVVDDGYRVVDAVTTQVLIEQRRVTGHPA